MLNITELRRLEENATPGEWAWWMSENPPFELCSISEVRNEVRIGITIDKVENAAFVAASRNHFRQLLDIVEAFKLCEWSLARLCEDQPLSDNEIESSQELYARLKSMFGDVEVGDE